MFPMAGSTPSGIRELRGSRRFPTTRWSLVVLAGEKPTLSSRDALAELCEKYNTFLIHKRYADGECNGDVFLRQGPGRGQDMHAVRIHSFDIFSYTILYTIL